MMLIECRKATPDDLPRLRAVFTAIVEDMRRNGPDIWDDVYPCEFFPEDIAADRLYLLTENDEIVAAFALLGDAAGASYISWKEPCAPAMYVDRLGVNVAYRKRGIAGKALDGAAQLAREQGAQYLRLFVVDSNAPAIRAYESYGFSRAEGAFAEVIDEELTLYEYGYELPLF